MRPLPKIGKTPAAVAAVILFATAVLMPAPALAAGPTVTATVDRNGLNPDDTVTLTVSVDAEQDVTVGQPTLPPLNDFDVLNEWTGQSQQANMVYTNQGPQFKHVYATHYNYLLQPKRQGTLTIGVVDVVVDGKGYKTQPISVKVAPGAGVPQGRSRGSRPQQPGMQDDEGQGGAFPPPSLFDDDEDDLFSQLLRRRGMAPPSAGGSRTLPVNPQDAFFIQVDTDKTEAFVGEQVTVSFYLYTRGMIRDLDTLKYPSLKGFWKEDIEIATHLNFEQEVVNGIPYKKALLASFALFPIKEGQAMIDPYQAKCSVISNMDAFGGLGKAYTFTKSSKPVKIEVKALPAEGRPADFSGAVGDFQVSARVEDRNIVEGQPFTVRVRFEGRGNAKLIDLPKFDLPEGMELYDQQNEARFYRTGTSFKEFKVMAVARRQGDFTIPAMTVSVFDPQKRVYTKKTTDPISVHVGPGQGGQLPTLTLEDGAAKDRARDSKAAAFEPRLITDYKAASGFGFGARGGIPAPVWAGTFAALALLLAWRARIELGWGERKKNLLRVLKARMKKIDKLAGQGDWRAVGTEMTNALYFVLGTLSGEGGANMELDKLLMKAPPSVRRELAEPLRKKMEVFEMLTFAPEEIVAGLIKKPDEIRRSIQEMEKLMARAVSIGLSDEQSNGPEPGPKAS